MSEETAWNTRAEPITIMSPITTVSAGEPQTYVPLRTGTMDRDEYGYWVCSECGETLPAWVTRYPANYCPYCGARVVDEEEQGHMMADAIRKLEKVVEE